MIKIIPFILYLVLIALHQVVLQEATAIYTARIDLPGLLVLVVAMYKPELVAVWFGFVVGMVMAAEIPELVGWHALTMAGLGLVAYHVRDRLNIESLSTKLVVIFGGVLLHNTLMLAINGEGEFLYLVLIIAGTGAFYTTVTAWIFFLFKEKKITFKKVKTLF